MRSVVPLTLPYDLGATAMAGFANDTIALLNRCGDVFWRFHFAMFLQAGALVVILYFVDLALRRKGRAVFRYWMWSLVLLKLLLPVTLSSPASLASSRARSCASAASSKWQAVPCFQARSRQPLAMPE